MEKTAIVLPANYHALKIAGRLFLWVVVITAVVLAILHLQGLEMGRFRVWVGAWVTLLVVGKLVCDELASRVLARWVARVREDDGSDDGFRPWVGGARVEGRKPSD